ncbi:hypothetical protein PINS_up015569 [Pythium insidiosum]|nr:hypothetical protein PINS_up015569 [Pythium insidiosum]
MMLRSGWRYCLLTGTRPAAQLPSTSLSLRFVTPTFAVTRLRAHARALGTMGSSTVNLTTTAETELLLLRGGVHTTSRRVVSTNASLFRRCDRHASTSPSGSAPKDETAPLNDRRLTENTDNVESQHGQELESTTTTIATEDADATSAEPLSWRERAKTFAMEYGKVGICTHAVLSLLSFSIIYVGVSSGVDVSSILDSVGMNASSKHDAAANSAGSALIAYTIYKLLAPVRWPLTFAVTPVVVRGLRRRGYMLPAASTPRSSSSSPRSPPASESRKR